MDLDVLFSDAAMAGLFNELSAKGRRVVEQEIATICAIASERRCHAWKLGRSLCVMKNEIGQSLSEKQVKLFLGLLDKSSRHFQQAMRIYERLGDVEGLLPLIHMRVQHYLADRKHNPDAVADVIALAQDGVEVSQAVFEADVLPHYTKQGRVSEYKAEPSEPREEADDPEADDPEANESEADPWDEPELVEEEEAAPTEPVLLPVEQLEERRQMIVRRVHESVKNQIRDIDDFCRAQKIKKSDWFKIVHDGADTILEGMTSWDRIEVYGR